MTLTPEQRIALTHLYVQYMLEVQLSWAPSDRDTPDQLAIDINHRHQNENSPRFTDEQFLSMLKEYGAPVYERFMAA